MNTTKMPAGCENLAPTAFKADETAIWPAP